MTAEGGWKRLDREVRARLTPQIRDFATEGKPVGALGKVRWAAMTEREAAEALQGADTIPVIEGAMAYIKELWDKCLAAGIPAIPSRACGSGKS